MSIYNLLVLLCWFIFIIVWAVAAVTAKKNRGRSRWWTVRIALAAIVILVFHKGIQNGLDNFRLVTSSHPSSGTIAVILAVLGVGFAIWARMHLGRNWGMPMTIKEKPALVTSGPYAFVRHPIYTGMLTAVLGSVFLSGFAWILIFIGGALYFYYSSKKEEQVLSKEFPQEYPTYMKRTKMLIPFVF